MLWKYLKECLLLLQLLIFLAYAIEDVDYCNLNDCGMQHVACNNYGDLGPDCLPNTRFVSLISYKQYIVDSLNDLRNEIASGEPPFQPAQRMATLQWDGDLADLASLRTLRCTHIQDFCFSTKKYINPGQAAIWYSFEGLEDSAAIDRAVKKSLSSIIKYQDKFSPSYATSMPSPPHEALVGHFAIAIRDNNAFIGCAASISSAGDFYLFFLVCNYSNSNFVGHPIYKVGRPGSKCQTGTNKNYTSLCSKDEVYDFAENAKYEGG